MHSSSLMSAGCWVIPIPIAATHPPGIHLLMISGEPKQARKQRNWQVAAATTCCSYVRRRVGGHHGMSVLAANQEPQWSATCRPHEGQLGTSVRLSAGWQMHATGG